MRIGVPWSLLAGAALMAVTAGASAQTAAPPPAQTPPPSTPPAAAKTPPPVTSAESKIFGKILSVEDAVAVALETQPSIQARLSDYIAAAYRVDQALSPLFPQLTATGTAATSRNASTITSPTTSSRRVTTYTESPMDPVVARISISQLIFDFGKTFASTEAARKQADIALEDTELQRQVVTLTVKESFTNINFAGRLIQVNQQAVERAELNLKSARGFFEVGTRPKSDVARAEVDVANAKVDLIRARNGERLARVALVTAMGLPATTPVQVQDNLVFQPITLDRTRLQEDALRQRPEFRQARLNAEAADARMRRAFRDFFPDITGGGFYGATRGDLNEAWEINLNLNWTIFDGGNRVARHREARAALDGAQSRVKAAELDISREVEQAVINVVETEERIQAAQVAVTSAQENFRLAQGRFDAGVGTILELTDAQLALTQAQNSEAQALADFRISLARLDRAVGRR